MIAGTQPNLDESFNRFLKLLGKQIILALQVVRLHTSLVVPGFSQLKSAFRASRKGRGTRGSAGPPSHCRLEGRVVRFHQLSAM